MALPGAVEDHSETAEEYVKVERELSPAEQVGSGEVGQDLLGEQQGGGDQL